ncbi:MAG: hypothetical protein JWO38_978 [Gemmataceae bacterium]|nr:hypothetical protein [Gemmataceae bacterium]
MVRFFLGSVLALSVVVGTNAPVIADVGAPGLRSAKPTYRISTHEAFPDHVFVIYRAKDTYVKNEETGKEEWRSADEAEYVDITPDRPIVIPFDRDKIKSVAFIMRSRAAAESYKTALDLARASRELGGAVWLELPYRESVPEWHGTEITIDYRVQRNVKSGRLEIVRTTWNQDYQCCVVGLGTPVALVIGGLWLIRRRRARRITPPV